MMRRFTTASAIRPTTTALVPRGAVMAPVREFRTVFDICCSLVFMTACSMCFACWGNNIANAYKFGMYRFRFFAGTRPAAQLSQEDNS